MAGIFDEASAFDDGSSVVITYLCVVLTASATASVYIDIARNFLLAGA